MKVRRLRIIILLTLIVGSIEAQSDHIPTPVLDFYGTAEVSKNDRAPIETAQFGQLAGIWYCEGFQPDALGKEERVPFKAFWAWKYILDGYGVQDYFFQGKNEFRFWNHFKRGVSLTQLRVYDVTEKQWKIAFVTNTAGEIPGKPFGTFTANMEGGALVMKPPKSTNSKKMNRIVFFNITEDAFEWKSESSSDGGATWQVFMELVCKRIK